MAYNMKKKGKVGCPDCMAKGGKCMAHGGEVNEEMHPEHEESMPSDMMRDEKIEYSPGDNQSEVAKLAHGGHIDEDDARDTMEMERDEEDEDVYYAGGEVEARKVGMPQSDKAKYAQGGYIQKDVRQTQLEEAQADDHAEPSILQQILDDRKRRKLAEGGYVTEPVSDDFETRINMEPVHTREDEEHDVESSSLDDQSLVGQILKERKMKRRS